MKLVVFDLDQTLVDFIPIHDEAVRTLFKNYYGMDARLTEIDFAGRNLAENFTELGRLKGLAEERVKKDAPRLVKEYEDIFTKSMPAEGSKYVLPGVMGLLTSLSKTDHFPVLYTGDSKGIVDAVFRVTELGHYLRLAVYGTEAPTRADLLRLAMRKASHDAGRQFSAEQVVVIGDSVRDVHAGKEIGAVTIAVATGFHSRAALEQAKPDHLFESLRDTRAVLQAIG